MSIAGEAVLKLLVKTVGRNRPANAGSPKADTYEEYFEWQFDSSKRMFPLFPHFDPKGKTVLEVGCGTGGRSAYLAAGGAKRVVGIDINEKEIELARALSAKLKPGLGNLEFVATRDNRQSLELGQFDYVLMIDTMEHLVSPPDILKFAYAMTKPGGTCYASFIGWYHKNGSHTGILPWVNLLFSDETLLNYIRWKVTQPSYTPGRFDSDPPIERWRGLYSMNHRPGEYLNKITIATFRKAARYSLFEESMVTVLPMGAWSGKAGTLGGRVAHVLAKLPLFEELFHSAIVGEFRRRA